MKNIIRKIKIRKIKYAVKYEIQVKVRKIKYEKIKMSI